jgi:hypothetical protein
VFDGDEDQVRAFIADVNLERRDLKKGQKAALYAKLFPEPAKGGRGKTVTTDNSFTRPQLSNCRAIWRHSQALLDDVIADRTPLDKALAQVKDEQARASSTEAKTERLRAAAPDLADLVVDERMKLDEALAAMEERERKTRQIIEHGREAANDLTDFIGHVASIAAPRRASPTSPMNTSKPPGPSHRGSISAWRGCSGSRAARQRFSQRM